MNEQQLTAVKQALAALKKGTGWMEHGEAITALQSIISQESAPAPVQSLQCAHCHVTIETLNDKAMHLIAENERLNKTLTWEQNRAERIGTHGPGCHTWGPAHYECLLRVNAELVEALKELVYETETVSIGDYSEEAHDIAVSKARAALAKATGGTQ